MTARQPILLSIFYDVIAISVIYFRLSKTGWLNFFPKTAFENVIFLVFSIL